MLVGVVAYELHSIDEESKVVDDLEPVDLGISQGNFQLPYCIFPTIEIKFL